MDENDENDEYIKSPIMATQYAKKAAEILNSISKNHYIVLAVIGLIIVFSILDILAETDYAVISDYVSDVIITILAGISVILLSILLFLTLKWKKMMFSWSYLFERNSIITGLILSMNKRTKEDALNAISDIFDDLCDPLSNYLKSDQDKKDFFDVKINEEKAFDVLLDSERIIKSDNNELKNILDEKGAIIIRINDKDIDREDVVEFEKITKEYHMKSKKKIRLALMIGENVSDDAEIIAQKIDKSHKYIRYFVLVEKPSITL
ncbi:MAG: hypothetical protein ACPKQO_02715 [Nitrososphaeraceae archaeon]